MTARRSPPAPSPRLGAMNSSSAHCSTTRCSFANRTREFPPPARGLRPGALLVSGVINLAARCSCCSACRRASDARIAATWALVQFLSGVWAGVLGANSPFLHGLVAGIPALVLGLVLASSLPAQFVVVSWFLAPAAALVAARHHAVHRAARGASEGSPRDSVAPPLLRRVAERFLVVLARGLDHRLGVFVAVLARDLAAC